MGFAPLDACVPKELQVAAAEGAGKNNSDEGAASELWLGIGGSAPLLENESHIKKHQ